MGKVSVESCPASDQMYREATVCRRGRAVLAQDRQGDEQSQTTRNRPTPAQTLDSRRGSTTGQGGLARLFSELSWVSWTA